MTDKLFKMKPTLSSYNDYLLHLISPSFKTDKYKSYDWKGDVQLKPINNILAIYVSCKEDFDLAVSILNDKFPEEKKDVEVRFFNVG